MDRTKKCKSREIRRKRKQCTVKKKTSEVFRKNTEGKEERKKSRKSGKNLITTKSSPCFAHRTTRIRRKKKNGELNKH